MQPIERQPLIKLAKTVAAYGTPEFETVLKEELQNMPIESLPLQQGLSQSSHVSEGDIGVTIINVTETAELIQVKTGIFYSGIIAGSCCTDDPTPMCELPEYCEVVLNINKITGETTATLCRE